MEEIWKPIKGFEMYEVSNYGEVRSLPRNGTILKTRKLEVDDRNELRNH